MLNIGVIGCGAIGQDHIRRIIEVVPNANVIACSDYFRPAAEKIAQKYQIKNIYDTGEALIASPEVDAVLIASSDASHANYVLKCLKEQKYVLCEKPLAQNANDCLKMINEEVKLSKKLVQVGFMRRFDPGYVALKDIIRSGELGAPLIIHACHRNVSQPEGFTSEMGVSNVAIHELDICRWLLEDEYSLAKVQKVRQSSLSNGYDNPQIVLLETANGSQIDVELQVSDAYGYDIQCQIVCEKGTINLPDPSMVVKRANANCSFPILTNWTQRFIEAYDIELNSWVNAVINGSFTGASAWDGYAACVAADTLNTSRGKNEFLKVEMIEKPALYK